MRLLDLYRKRRRSLLRRQIAKGDAARDRRQWRHAAEAYGRALRINSALAPIHVQHGHALKEAGDRSGAYDAYHRALAIDRSGETLLQIGHVLKLLGRSNEAIDAYREALIVAPGLSAAVTELIAMGARDAVPDRSMLAMIDTAVSTTSNAVQTLGEALCDVRSLTFRPQHSFDDFRRAFPVLPPPSGPANSEHPLLVVIEGRAALASDLRCSLDSLLDQTVSAWRATVIVDEAMTAHPVASMAFVDPRITFTTTFPDAIPGPCLRLEAGTALDRHTIDWFLFTAACGSPAAAYCDHDHAELTWRGHRRHFAPVLQPRFDRFWFDGAQSSPPLIYVDQPYTEAVAQGGRSNARILRNIAARGGRVVHVPRLLATVIDIDIAAATAQPDPIRANPAPAAVARSPSAMSSTGPAITVVIPTRDQPRLLDRSVATLIGHARFPECLDIVVVDNRSEQDETATLLARLGSDHGVRTLRFDEPFNWSRANNLAIGDSRSPLLLLMNNDTEMLTPDWDVILAERLSAPDVGVIGARLLYPDRTVQHAGILFGMDDAPPTHDGVGAEEGDPGPDGRWIRARAAAAVTGAFMAMTRETWAATGGFDALSLPIGFNDIDMCLRIRRLGLTVLYVPELLLIHHESKTRGRNVTVSQVAWDRTELRAFHDRWGEAMFDDPSLNPQWVRHGSPFSGYREPPTSEIARYITLQSGRLTHPPAITIGMGYGQK